jgi:prepilin-type processing-associated H-X9-DG protein
MVDEHADSINDAWMMPIINDGQSFGDLPASYHNGACGFGLADGHAEIHRWLEAATKVPVLKTGYINARWQELNPNSRDVHWTLEHSTARR